MYIRLLVLCHLRPIWLCTPTKSNLHFEISSTALSEPALYILLTFQVPNLISIFFCLRCLSKESIQVRGFVWSLVTSLVFYCEEFLAPRPTPQAGGPPLVGCQYIHSYPPKLEGVSSIRNLRTCHAVVTRDPPNMAGSFVIITFPLYGLNKD
jgi:hypothetical protein